MHVHGLVALSLGLLYILLCLLGDVQRDVLLRRRARLGAGRLQVGQPWKYLNVECSALQDGYKGAVLAAVRSEVQGSDRGCHAVDCQAVLLVVHPHLVVGQRHSEDGLQLLACLHGDHCQDRRREENRVGLPSLHLVVVYGVVHASNEDGLLVAQQAHALVLQLNDSALNLAVLQLKHLSIPAGYDRPPLHVDHPRVNNVSGNAIDGNGLVHRGPESVKQQHLAALCANHQAGH
mmetsp:Transcript_15211/g.42593  ORF Transcript_15211/g.42593 Transcript_15211/m.42593 type:complete len:234 (+) Transcript_15211:469-1170(+)